MKVGWWKAVVWAGYVAGVALVAARHEPWADEAQAWLMARDLPVGELVGRFARYEGTPPLWHLCLKAVVALGLPYQAMNWLAVGLAAVGVAIWLRWARLPAVLMVLAPFSFFLFFQYAVVARNNSLAPPLVLGLAALYRRRWQWPVAYATLLALLAASSVFGALMAGSLFGLDGLRFAAGWRQHTGAARRRAALAAAIFLAALAAVAWTVWPPADSSFNVIHGTGLERLAMALYFSLDWLPIELAGRPSLVGTVATEAIIIISSLWFARRGVLWEFLLPYAAFTSFALAKYYNAWHTGYFFLAWLLALWLSFDKVPADSRPAQLPPPLPLSLPWLRPAMIVAAGTLLAVHVFWAAVAGWNDFRRPYSGSRQLAAWIHGGHFDAARIDAVGFSCVAVQPYFNRNRFAAWGQHNASCFWWWSTQGQGEWPLPICSQGLELLVDDRPDLLIVALVTDPDERECRELTAAVARQGLPYGPPRLFEGHMFWKSRIKERGAFVVFERLPPGGAGEQQSR